MCDRDTSPERPSPIRIVTIGMNLQSITPRHPPMRHQPQPSDDVLKAVSHPARDSDRWPNGQDLSKLT